MARFVFSFDTEDFVTPESDDALRLIAQTLTRRGIRASFAVVGDKARALWTRGRRDVIEEMKLHDIQYHANTHLMWPNTTRLVSRMTWDEGVNLVMQIERHGVDDVSEVFGVRPQAYCRCGGNWSPQQLCGLYLLGLRSFPYSRYLLPNGEPVWFVGMLHGRQNLYIEKYFKQDVTLDDMKRDVMEHSRRYANSSLPIVIVAHPCMFATSQFYDLANQRGRGRYPKKWRWRPAPVLKPAEVRRRIAILDATADFIAGNRDLGFITHGEVLAAHAEPSRWLTPAQLFSLARQVRSDFNCQKAAGGFLSAADIAGVLSLALSRWRADSALPRQVPVRRLFGPSEPTPALRRPRSVPLAGILAACEQVEREIDVRRRLPNYVRLGEAKIPPASFLLAMADALLLVGARRKGNVAVAPQPPYPKINDVIAKEVRCGSTELPFHFDPGTIITYTHQQTWSARPAVSTR